MIKGKFIGRIKITSELADDREEEFLPPDELQEEWESLSKTMEDILRDYLFDDEDFAISVEEIESELIHNEKKFSRKANRNLDNIFFVVKRGNQNANLCFSDLTAEEREEVMKGKDETWLKSLCQQLADTLKNFDISETTKK